MCSSGSLPIEAEPRGFWDLWTWMLFRGVSASLRISSVILKEEVVPEMEDSYVIIARFENALDAEILRGRLVSEGIEAHLKDETTVNMNWTWSNAIGGVKVLVRESDAEQALQLIAPSAQEEKDDEGWGSCPQCSSRKLRLQLNRRWTNLSWLLLGLPLFFPKREYYCQSCAAVFEKPNDAPKPVPSLKIV